MIKEATFISSEDFLSLIYETQSNKKDELKCQICLKESDSNENQIILCDFCNGAIHPKCYGEPIENSLSNGI